MRETNEKWLQGYEGVYSITTQGEVFKTLPSGLKTRLKHYYDKDGYCIIDLSDNWGVKDRYYVHKLVAITFLDNPFLFSRVSFKDGNKENILLDNLVWEAEASCQLPVGSKWVDGFEGRYYLNKEGVFNKDHDLLKGFETSNGKYVKYNLRKNGEYKSIYVKFIEKQ
jgi:hypothetical protein